MNRQIGILILIYIVVILLFAYLKPEEIDWTPSFSIERTSPFASRVVFREMDTVRDEVITESDRPIYNTVRSLDVDNTAIYVFLNRRFAASDLDLESLFNFVSSGNTAFISSTSLPWQLLDTLGVESEYEYVGTDNITEWFYEENVTLSLENQREREWPAAVSAGFWWYSHLDSVDVSDSTWSVLGNMNDTYPVFTQHRFGKGQFILHAFPFAFTNYHMLYKNNHTYVAEALAMIPHADVMIWDTYYTSETGGRAQSPLAALNRYRSFQWAYYIGIIGALLFIIFTAKRRQRIIPVLREKRNTTLDFVRTIGDLYFYRGDISDLVAKKISILQSRLQRDYRIQVTDFSAEDAQEIALRSGRDKPVVEALFSQIRHLKAHPRTHLEMLWSLQKNLDAFLGR